MNEFKTLAVRLTDPEAFLHVIGNMCTVCSHTATAIYWNMSRVFLASLASLGQSRLD